MSEVSIQPGPGHNITIQRTPVYQIKIERIGIPGPANSLSIGTVTDGGAASATITGQPPNQVLNLVLPEGPEGPQGPDGPEGEQGEQGEQGPAGNDGNDGAAATISVGTVTTVAAGQPATVTNVGTSAAAVFDFAIPQGADGDGAGDMVAATYDPQNIAADAFDRANHTGTQALSTISDAGTAAAKDVGTSAGNVPELDGDGKLDTAVLPAVAITDTFVVNSQAAMLALDAEKGDVAIRTDLNKSFILQTNSPTTLADWKELLTPTDAVLSVAGLTGAISASALKTALAIAVADITDASANGRSLISAADYAAMRSLLGLVIGTNVQAYDAQLAAFAANTGVSGTITVSTSDPSGGANGDVWLKYTP